jgi:hypothetical protein
MSSDIACDYVFSRECMAWYDTVTLFQYRMRLHLLTSEHPAVNKRHLYVLPLRALALASQLTVCCAHYAPTHGCCVIAHCSHFRHAERTLAPPVPDVPQRAAHRWAAPRGVHRRQHQRRKVHFWLWRRLQGRVARL